ncbi:two-component system, unclassified family, response regulator [Catalinimonas alkaloidigena]|uniref:Two-component system, unclassified family, response regulator n=1 Tax=Catalinimonas alkaloidigena TaxID=1075417 RepID=A0A1G9RK82_9BACT|nr:response regulator [Catalinimonas alkaloidigena]SDM23633.1 two-component system, unclassified family, response regulator [Catalinimonas alkaloidigena]
MTQTQGATVLFIEDSDEDADLALRSFRKHGLKQGVKWIDDGQEALDYLLGEGKYASSPPPLPKVILLDLKLPKVGGLEILERIKADARRKHVPVIVLTSSNQTVDVERAYQSGANSYIVKPVDYTKFSDVIGQLGIYWLGVNVANDTSNL